MSNKTPDGCAYLKSKGTRDIMLANGDWTVMTSQEKVSGCAKFAANGEKCTTDPFAAEQICE
jgi:hypothetical protein